MNPRIAPSLPGNVMSARCPIAMAIPTPGASTPEVVPPAAAPPEPTSTTTPPVSSLQIIDPYGPNPKMPDKQLPPPSGSSLIPRWTELYGAELYCCPSILTSLRHQAQQRRAPPPRRASTRQGRTGRRRGGRRRTSPASTHIGTPLDVLASAEPDHAHVPSALFTRGSAYCRSGIAGPSMSIAPQTSSHSLVGMPDDFDCVEMRN